MIEKINFFPKNIYKNKSKRTKYLASACQVVVILLIVKIVTFC